MVFAIENRVSLKSLKMALVALSLLAIISTLYVYDNVVYGTTDRLSSRLLGAARRARHAKWMAQPRKELVWVMSHPYAGADDIINFVERATFKSMATNYGDKHQTRDMQLHNNVKKSVLLQKRWYRQGPYKNNVDFPADTEEVLVKTYCTGYCLHTENGGFCDRIPYSRELVDLGRFWETCAAGTNYQPGRKPEVKRARPYWKNRVKKVILVVRNPLEIVINQWRVHMRDIGEKVSETNFRNYCPLVDAHYLNNKEVKTAFRQKWIKNHIDGVLCVTEFFRIMTWYTNAFDVAYKRTPLIIYREDYVKNSQKTTNAVLKYAKLTQTNFNGLPNVNTAARLYYTDAEKEKIGTFLEAVAKDKSPAWRAFSRYFK